MSKEIITVGNTKIEVDMEGARKVDSYRVGDNVKLLKKGYRTYESHPAIIVGFDAFKNRPAIVVAYLVCTYNQAEVKFTHLTEESEDEICPMQQELVELDKADLVGKLDAEIVKKTLEIDELKQRRNYFLKNFAEYFGKAG